MKSSLALVLSAAALLARAADIYVSPCGSDQNAGDSLEKPFRTLTKAQEAARKATGDEDVRVHLGQGTFKLEETLKFSPADSGKNGHTVQWIGTDKKTTISGGVKVSGWTANDDGMYVASVPEGIKSRNLYIDGQAANYARRKIDRKKINYTDTGMVWTTEEYDWLATTEGIENGEVRFLASFTDRYAPIEKLGDHELIMHQPVWAQQIWGWDHVKKPYGDHGVWVQNAIGLLHEGGQYYHDSKAGKVYYKPLDGQNMEGIDAYLGAVEVLLSISGTSYDDVVHDISFEGITFAHSTWLRPGEFGYVDQQTGGYIGDFDRDYPEFEATRPWWWQNPSAIQISAAAHISLSTCTFHQLGAGGVGIGNDENAHVSGIGLGASNVTVSDSYFTQVMGNSITAGGIQADAHHPPEDKMTNRGIVVSGNIFYNNSALFASTVPIFYTYVQDSAIRHNDLSHCTYGGINHGYGWGSNDGGGSVFYIIEGLYKYQPMYETETISRDNDIDGNLLHDYGYSLQDLGGIYSLSRSPGTIVRNNYMYDTAYKALYPDEGSANMTFENNLGWVGDLWYGPNDGRDWFHTGNNTLLDNWGSNGDVLDGFPDHTGFRNNTFLRNFVVPEITDTTARAQRAAFRAGILPGKRAGRPTSNDPNVADGYLAVDSKDGKVVVTLTNFDDVDFTNVAFEVSADGVKFEPVDVPTSVPADSSAVATFSMDPSGSATVKASATYKNPRTGRDGSLSREKSL